MPPFAPMKASDIASTPQKEIGTDMPKPIPMEVSSMNKEEASGLRFGEHKLGFGKPASRASKNSELTSPQAPVKDPTPPSAPVKAPTPPSAPVKAPTPPSATVDGVEYQLPRNNYGHCPIPANQSLWLS